MKIISHEILSVEPNEMTRCEDDIRISSEIRRFRMRRKVMESYGKRREDGMEVVMRMMVNGM